jgi:hypothetical protein
MIFFEKYSQINAPSPEFEKLFTDLKTKSNNEKRKDEKKKKIFFQKKERKLLKPGKKT